MAKLSSARPAVRGAVLLVGDLICFIVFAVAGLRSHEDGITLGSLLRAAAPFQVGWLLSAFALGLVGPRPSAQSPRAERVLLAWLPAWVFGLAVRSLVFGRGFAPLFAIIALLVNAVLLLLWRSVVTPRVWRGAEGKPLPWSKGGSGNGW